MGLNEQTREFNGKPPISQAGDAFFRVARFFHALREPAVPWPTSTKVILCCHGPLASLGIEPIPCLPEKGVA